MAVRERQDEMIAVEDAHGMPTYPHRNTDAIVVGAGPAGATTALLLARAGHAVTLLDRDAFPRPKPCGDCLSAAATDALRRLGLLDRVLAAGPAQLRGWTITAPGGACFTGRFHGAPTPETADAAGLASGDAPARAAPGATALALERTVLDRILLDAALDAGARFLQLHVTDLVRGARGVEGVTGRDPDGRETALGARLVVGADGLRSVVAARMGAVRRPPRLRKVSLTAHVRSTAHLTADPELGEMHVADGACLGVAPMNASADRWNVTLVVTDQADALRRLGPHRLFASRLAGFPRLAPALRSLVITEPFLASGPFDRPVRPTVDDGVALVGDAAGYFDPFTGQGIYRALTSARSLAAVAGAALASDTGGAARAATPIPASALRPYARAQRRAVAGPVRLQKLIDAVLARPRLADTVIRRLAGAHDLADALVAVTGDLERPFYLAQPRLLAELAFPASLETAP